MGKFWSLSNTHKQKGRLDQTKEFRDTSNEVHCAMVMVPITAGTKDTVFHVAGLLSDNTRSFEIWWDKQEKDLAFVLTSQSQSDLQRYETALSNMYPNCMFTDLNYTIPKWFDVRYENYQIFDVGLYHGHYTTTLDKTNSPQLITQLANMIQLTDKAWIQFVFASCDFTPYLKGHLNILDQKIKSVTNKNYRTWIDDLTNKKSYENPENGRDFANHYKELHNQAVQKLQNSQIIMSIRGLIQSENRDTITSLFDNITSSNDHLTVYNYKYSNFYSFKKPKNNFTRINNKKTNHQKIKLFESRLIPLPQKFLSSALRNYFEKSILGNYKDRKPLPFLILNPDELPLFIHLPESTTKNLKTTRNVSLPSRQTNKAGFSLGYLEKTNFEPKNDSVYGIFVKSSDSDCAVISPEDFTRHIYCVGGTGAGKTTLIRQIAKHLEISNLNQTFPNSFIYLDPKGDDSLKFIQQCNKESIQNNSVHFLDPIKTNFSINPLELPRYKPEERQQIVSRYVGYFMEIVRQWYGQQQSFVQMERIFRVLLYYMYLNNDAPTFLDMYEIIIHLQEEQESFLQTMFSALGMPGDDLKQALTSIAILKPESFTPLLNRVEQFATDPILKQVFCVRHGTVSFERLIESGQYTITRISALHIPHHVQPLAIQAFVIKLWFTIQERAARIENEQDRNHVILAIDEFQIVKDLQVLPMILSQARSYRLGLLLSHQTTAQISESLLEEITGNCGTQLAGRISGKDASRMANIWDPKFSRQIQQQLAAQEDFHWTIKMRATPGSEQPTPIQFWLPKPPKSNLNEDELRQFITTQHNLYGYDIIDDNDEKDGLSIFQQHHIQKNRWLKYITVDFIQDKVQWLVLVQLYWNKSLNLTDITKNIQAKNRDDVSATLQNMLEKKYITKINKSRNVRYALTKETKKRYFDFDSRAIGTAKEIPRLTHLAIEAYLQKGLFVTLALQKIKKDKDRSDLIAYSYDTGKSISVEIESSSELSSHPEHTRYNMEKWKKMGFDACHLWSSNPKLSEIYKSQTPDEYKKDVEVFII